MAEDRAGPGTGRHGRMRGAAAYRRWCGPVFGALTLVIVLCVLFAGDDVGLSNNGDFGRVMAASSLQMGDRVPRHTFVDRFVITEGSWLRVLTDREGWSGYPSLQVLLVRLSVAANMALNTLTGQPGVYRLAVLGVMYALLYAAAVGLLFSRVFLRRVWLDVPVKAAALAVLCDIGYTAYFNSFYSEPLQHVMLIFCAAALARLLRARPGPGLREALEAALAAVGYGWSKPFNIPLAMLLALVVGGVVLIRGRDRRAVGAALGALAVLAGLWTVTPDWMDQVTSYNGMFFGVIRDVGEDRARTYLTDMELPEELADFRDTDYYLTGVMDELAERGLLEQALSVDKGDLLRFYITHPGRLWEQAKLTARHCGMIRPWYLANLGEGYPKMTYSDRMSMWSHVRDWLALDTLGGCIGSALILWALLALRWRGRGALLGGVLMGALAYGFLLPVILNGEGDLAKHMFAYGELTDLTLLGSLALALDGAGRDRRGLAAGALGIALIGVLAVPPVWAAAAEPQGTYVTFGSFQGQPLRWQVVDREADRLTLLCQEPVDQLAFDEAGGNDWRYSSLRAWLNGPFLEGFTQEERARLVTEERPVLLADARQGEAAEGDLEFACSHIAVLSARNYDRAYRTWAADAVALPDIDLIVRLADMGYDISGDYWLRTPYCPSEDMVRLAGRDGHIYLAPADTVRGVRPMVTVTAGPAEG